MKKMTAKYHVIQYSPSYHSTPTPAAPTAYQPSTTVAAQSAPAVNLTEDEKYMWQWFNTLPTDDQRYVNEFCPANPTGKALLPRAKVDAGQPPDRSLNCQGWLSARTKLGAH
jgi:hypothetical protein